MVPLPDEDASWLEYNAYRGLLKDTNIIDKPNKPLPAYSWAYRPENRKQWDTHKLLIKFHLFTMVK